MEERKSTNTESQWISVEHPALKRREKYTNMIPALPMLIIFSIASILIYSKGHVFISIIGELLVIAISFAVWRLNVNSGKRWIKAIRFTDNGFLAKARNGKIDRVHWGDTHSLFKIGPGDFGDIAYMASYRKKGNINWLSKYLGSPYTEGGTLISESILQVFYSKWTSYYEHGGKYRWMNTEKRYVQNNKRLLIIGFFLMVSNIVIAYFFLSELSVALIVINATLISIGFISVFIGGISYSAGKLYISNFEKLENDTYPVNVYEYLKNHIMKR